MSDQKPKKAVRRKMPAFDGLLQRPGFVYAIGCGSVIIALGLAYVAYVRFTLHQHGVAVFAALGAILVSYYAWIYLRDARFLASEGKAKSLTSR